MTRLRHEYELGEILHQGPTGAPKGVTVVFGGQAGSEGKGAIAGWLARRYPFHVAASTFMPNAGHTWVGPEGTVVVTQLPIGLVSNAPHLVLGASSVIDVDKLMEEIHAYSPFSVEERLSIHPRAHVMRPEYREWEAENLQYIASTGKGCGAALAAKARREQTVILAGDHPELARFVRKDMDNWLNKVVDAGMGVLAEQSQGFDLDINHGFSYPYCTSRQCTPSQICADLGLDARLVTNSIAVVRTQPIRVGNVEGGHSGEYGSEEITWGDVSGRAGRSVEERTTVTDRVRRVFEFDFDRIGDMSRVCRPTAVALTFVDYIDPDLFGLTEQQHAESLYGALKASSKFVSFKYKLEQALRRPTYNCPVKIVKTGPKDNQTIPLGLSL